MNYNSQYPIANSAITTAKSSVAELKLEERYEYNVAFGAMVFNTQWLADDARELSEETLKETPDTIKIQALARCIISKINKMEEK